MVDKILFGNVINVTQTKLEAQIFFEHKKDGTLQFRVQYLKEKLLRESEMST